MRRTAGIHFGHDAGIAVISDNGIETFLSKERLSRVKHASGWDFETIQQALSKNACESVGLSITQGTIGYLKKGLGFVTGANGRFSIESTSPRFEDSWAGLHSINYERIVADLVWAQPADMEKAYKFSFNDAWPVQLTNNGELRYTKGLRQVELIGYKPGQCPFDYVQGPEFGNDACTLRLDRTIYDAKLVMHHLSHAYYGFWASGLETALVISHDGGHTPTWDGGGYFFCSRKYGVLPLAPGGFWMGQFYRYVSTELGVMDSGKLMGLAPYGEPKYIAEAFIGTIGDVEFLTGMDHKTLATQWVRSICNSENKNKDELSAWNTYGGRPPQFVADIAASAQKILELNITANVETGLSLVRALGADAEGIILVGGVALNCPANSIIYRKYGPKVYVPPACNDEGLALGNALCAFFRTYKDFPPIPATEYDGVYLGQLYAPAEIHQAVSGFEKVSDFSGEMVAKLLHDGAIIGLFHGRSEIGPRALGHRSILASPLIAENWPKVNHVKGREPWRPFAPICLEQDMAEHFADSDMKSRFMLFTHQVKNPNLPAITHADNTARAQAANADCGIVFDILTAFKALTGYGVLMNTSFNGKNVPIVETPAEAVAEARRIGLDYFVCDQGVFKVAKASDVSPKQS